MRIFVLGTGATGSLLAHLLARQGHRVWCGDKDPEKARRFLGRKSPIPVVAVNGRNLRAVVRAGKGCHLVVNALPAVFNENVMRSALRLKAHYLDMASHLKRQPFKAEQLRYDKRFCAKGRAAVIDAGVAPGLTNLLARRGAALLDTVGGVYIRLFEDTESRDPISSWSAEVSFEEAIARPRVVRAGRFRMARRFGERELYPFPPPIGRRGVVLMAQDEVATLPHLLGLREMDVKIGGNEIDRLRRWYRQGKLGRTRGLVRKRFPSTPTPRQVAALIRRGILHNARFAASVVVTGAHREQPLRLRFDCVFPTLYQIRQRGMLTSPIAWATAQLAALFVKHFPRGKSGVYPPEALPAAAVSAILADVRKCGIGITLKSKRLKKPADEEGEF